jgi:hypothetical protein
MAAEADPSPGWAAREPRPRAPLFFLSYARAGRPSGQVVEFFNDLSEDVAELVGRPAGSDPGFMDRSMRTGVRWLGELLQAVGSCQVFVALLSDPYVTSEWCRIEWHAFSRRTVLAISGDDVTHRTGVIPVIWTPMPERRLPPVVSAVQRFEPRGLAGEDIGRQYQEEGVYGFKRLNQEDMYRCAVYRLAQAIAEFHFAYKVEPLVFKPTDLDNSFGEEW